MTTGQNHLSKSDILTDRTDMLPGICRHADKKAIISLFRILDHDDGIIFRWNEIARIHPDIIGDEDRALIGGSMRIFCLYR